MKKEVDPNTIIKATVTLAGLFIVYKILQKIGVLPDKESRSEELNLAALESADYFDYTKFLATYPAGTLLLTSASAAQYVDELWNATGYFNDDEEEIYGVFRKLKTKSQVAFLAKKFNDIKGQDLYAYLKNYLNNEELLTIKKIIDPKPKYNL